MSKLLATKCKRVRVLVCRDNDIDNIICLECSNEQFEVQKNISDLTISRNIEYGVYPIYFCRWFCLMDFKSMIWSRLNESDGFIDSF